MTMDNADWMTVALYALGLAQGLWIGWAAWRRPKLLEEKAGQ